MTTLGSLFNKAKAVEDAAKPVTPAPPPASTPRTGFKIGGSPSGTPSAPPKQESEGGPPVVDSPAPALNKGFKIGGSVASKATPPKQEPVVGDAPPASESPAPATRTPFADETPATLPQREIPEDVSAEALRFIENLDQLHSLAPEPQLATASIRNIMVELKSNPQYIKHVSNSDVRMMIQFMRETMGIAKATKEKKVTARKAKVSADVAAVMDEFADLDNLG